MVSSISRCQIYWYLNGKFLTVLKWPIYFTIRILIFQKQTGL